MEKTTFILKNGLLALLSAIFFVSTIFISDMISVKSTVLSLLYIAFAAFVYGLAMKSESGKTTLVKWAISIPLSYLVLQYFWTTHYSIRALNWILPDYGHQTGGGIFSGAFQLAVFSILCIIAVIIGQYTKTKNYQQFDRIRLGIVLAFSAALIIIVLVLEQLFPSYQYVINL